MMQGMWSNSWIWARVVQCSMPHLRPEATFHHELDTTGMMQVNMQLPT